MDETVEPESQDGNDPEGFTYSPHETDPDGIVIPPPTPQMAKGRIRCKVYNREEWGGRPPKETPVMYTPVTKVVLSRTETEPCFTEEDCKLRVRQMQNAHMDEEGEPDIKYHFLVGGDGALYEGRGYTTVGRSYPVTPNNLQNLSKSCLEIAFIQKSESETTKEMQSTASHCLILGRNAKYIYNEFDLYFVVNNDIIHVEHLKHNKEGDDVSMSDSVKPEKELESNVGSGVPQESSSMSNKLDPDQALSKDGENTFPQVKFERDEAGRPVMFEGSDTTEYASQSNVPLHDSESPADKDDEEVQPVKFIYRHMWKAKPPKWMHALNLPVNKVAVSFTETEQCSTEEECIELIQKLQEKHMEENDEPDIKHNFLIGGDGLIYEGRGYTRVGPIYPPSVKKIEQLNGTSIDIGIIDKHARQPSDKVIKGISWCLSTGVHRKYIEKNFDTYYIANKEIIHIQHPVAGAENKS